MVANEVYPSCRMRSHRGDHARFRALVRAFVLAAPCMFALSCRPEPPLPPDPDEPTPASSCDDHPALSLTTIAADSLVEEPAWMQVCTQCPVAEVVFDVGDGAGGVLDTEVVWGPDRTCTYAAPTAPIPARPSVPVSVSVRSEERVGTFEFDHPIPSDRSQDPVDLGTATWVLPVDDDTSRLLHGLELLDDPPTALALHLSSADANGDRVLTLGEARDDGARQDLCVGTTSWSVPASLLLRQVAAPLSQDDGLFGGLSARRGVLQGRLTEDADAIEDLVLLALVDLAASEPVLEAPPAAVCDAWSADLPTSPCVPCGPPSDGIAGLPACVPFVLEWSRAERANWTLTPVDPDNIPLGCRFPSGGDDDDSADP